MRRQVLQDTSSMEPIEPNLANMRISYEKFELTEDSLEQNPLAQFNKWLADAIEVGSQAIPEPNAMVLSTVNTFGEVHSRTVLLKSLSETGFVFYTNYQSQKARDLEQNPNVSVVFPWYVLHRQVIVTGSVTKVSRKESAEYFATRPHKSQLAAHISEQSQQIPNRAALEQQMEQLETKFPEGSAVTLPDHWGGYLISVKSLEFWQGRRSRLHDRLRYERTNENGLLNQTDAWQVTRLSP